MKNQNEKIEVIIRMCEKISNTVKELEHTNDQQDAILKKLGEAGEIINW